MVVVVVMVMEHDGSIEDRKNEIIATTRYVIIDRDNGTILITV